MTLLQENAEGTANSPSQVCFEYKVTSVDSDTFIAEDLPIYLLIEFGIVGLKIFRS